MKNSDGKLLFGIGLDNEQLRRDAKKSREIIKGISDGAIKDTQRMDVAFRGVASTLAKLGVAISTIDFAKTIYKLADDFEKGMQEVSTISETVTANMAKFKREIISLSTEIPIPANEAAKALYQIVSAGHDGAAGLKVLQVSAKAAVGGITETVTAADAITTMLNAYKKSADEAESISDQLFTTVRLGKTTMSELGHHLAMAVPIAASFGIESEQVLAALATLTKSGTPTAQAVTQIRSSIVAASKVLGDGYFATHTYQQGLLEIAERAGGSEAKLRELVPEIEAVNGVLGLTGLNAQAAANDLAELTNSAGATEQAFNKMASTTDSQLTILKNNMIAKFSDLGADMVESVGSIARILNEAFNTGVIDNVISALGTLIAMYGTYKATLIAISAIHKISALANQTIEYLKMAKALGLATANQIAFNRASLMNPYTAIAGAIAAVVGGLVLFSNHMDKAAESAIGVARASKRANEKLENEVSKIQVLTDIINDGNTAYEVRKKAINDLRAIVPDYHADITEEGEIINNNTEAIKAYITQLERKIRLEASSDEYKTAIKQRRDLEKQLKKQEQELADAERYNSLVAAPAVQSKIGTSGMQAISMGAGSGTAKPTQGIKHQIERTRKEIAETDKAIEELNTEIIGLQSAFNTVTNNNATTHITPPNSQTIKANTDEAAKAFSEYEKIILAANEQLASEEIQLQRNKIEDKIALIEFDRQQTIAAIEKTRAEALKAWTDSGKETGSFDGSIFQDLIDAANLQAAFDTDNAISEQTKKEQEELDALLQQFRTYEQQRADIVAEYNNKIVRLREAGENEAAKVAEKRRDEALTALAQSIMEESDLWVRLFEDASKKTVSQIEEIISETESLLDYLQGKDGAEIPLGFTDEQLKSLKGSPEAIKKIQDAIKRLKGEIGSKSPFKQFTNDINDAIDQIKAGGKDNIGAGIMNIGNAVNTIAPHVKQFGDDLSNIFGDSSIGENIGILTDTLTGVGTAAAGVGQIMTGDILGGITSVVSGISSIFSMARQAAERHRKALEAVMNAQIAQQREYNLLLLEQNLLYEKGTTIFGSDDYGKAMNAIEVYKQALADLNEAMAGTNAQKNAQRRRYNFLSIFGIKDAQSTLKQIYAGLADIEIVTGHKKTGLFGWGKGKDLYSSVLSVYPDLIKANGEFNKELAQTIINTRKMSDEDKNALQNMIDLYEQYEEAMQEVRDYLSGIFGELGNTMSDALVDAFKNGSDAAEAFSKSVSEMLEDLAQQMIYSVTLAPIMEKAQEQMLEVMKNGNLSDDEKFARYAGILSNLTDEALSQQENANYLMKLYQDMAASKGIDIFQPDDTGREATTKGIATASQDTVDELNGRFTAIQSHTFDIREAVNSIAASQTHDFSRIEINTDRLQTIDANVFGIREGTNILVANSARMLEHLAGIEMNTDRLHAMGDDISEVRSGLNSLRHSVDDMALKGIKLKK